MQSFSVFIFLENLHDIITIDQVRKRIIKSCLPLSHILRHIMLIHFSMLIPRILTRHPPYLVLPRILRILECLVFS